MRERVLLNVTLFFQNLFVLYISEATTKHFCCPTVIYTIEKKNELISVSERERKGRSRRKKGQGQYIILSKVYNYYDKLTFFFYFLKSHPLSFIHSSSSLS